jgi:hypothetical protein
VPDDRLQAAGLGHVAAEAGVLDRRGGVPVVVEGQVAGEGAGQHPRHLRDVGHLARPQEPLRVPTSRPFHRRPAGVVHQTGEGLQQAGLAGADLPQQQHELAAPHGQVDALHAEGAVVVHRGQIGQLQHLEGLVRRRVGQGGGPVHQVDARRKPGEVDAAGQRDVSAAHARVPGASVMTAPATRPNQSKPLTAVVTSSAVDRSQPSSRRPASR